MALSEILISLLSLLYFCIILLFELGGKSEIEFGILNLIFLGGTFFLKVSFVFIFLHLSLCGLYLSTMIMLLIILVL